MTTISPTTASPASTPGAASQSSPAQGLGALTPQDFMQLLVAQLSRQNPLDPVTTSQFMAETAALATLEQVANLNQQMSRALATEQVQAAVSAIGRTVSATGSSGQAVSGKVTGVKLGPSGPTLEVGGAEVPLSSVTSLT